jgi:hypothetical protein
MRWKPCEYNKAIEAERLKTLRVTAKKRAQEQNEYFVIHYDEEDKKYRITSKTMAGRLDLEKVEVISPY